MLTPFLYGVSSNLLQQKSPTAEIIVPRKYMPIISTVGLFCYDKFEETPNEKVVNLSRLTKPYFNKGVGPKYSLGFHTSGFSTFLPHMVESSYSNCHVNVICEGLLTFWDSL